jgi:hypothetical protein
MKSDGGDDFTYSCDWQPTKRDQHGKEGDKPVGGDTADRYRYGNPGDKPIVNY